jgi:hypothetical protein
MFRTEARDFWAGSLPAALAVDWHAARRKDTGHVTCRPRGVASWQLGLMTDDSELTAGSGEGPHGARSIHESPDP